MTVLLHQLAFEQRMFWRSREAAVFIFIFPLLLYALLGSVYSGDIDGVPATDVLLSGLFGYGAATTAFGGLAIFLVNRREAGILKRLRATPLPPTRMAGTTAEATLARAASAPTSTRMASLMQRRTSSRTRDSMRFSWIGFSLQA